ncbi:hypothetical protein QZH41_001823 [Actinostola sp. cb2023]|nr:hypothetical protein QZH41_001823 [Actinostola sp. cb2023]
MNEIIAGIRAVKMYAWEWNYRDIVKSLRRKEVNLVRIKSVLLSFSKALYFTLRVIASLTSITTMLYTGIHLTAVNVFTVVCILNTMSDSTNRQIFGIINVFDSSVSINRIQAFLLQNHVQSIKDKNITDEKLNSNNTFAKTLKNISNAFRKDSKPNYNDTYSKSKYTVLKNMDDTFPNKTSNTKHGVDPYLELLQVSSGWVEDETSSTIHDISLKVESNMLLIVTGPVGSGKSTLLKTMLNEIDVKSGHISSSGKMAYVSQIPWIFTGTVRENIIFGKPFDETRYAKVLEVCELNADTHEFPKGDLCVIGQRGVMLSGGQRVRVSLARAVYSDADIFLLDDPLSAVDAKVGQHIFDKCICGELSGKIRILVTHQLQHLHRADEIVVLEEGFITRQGSFSEMSEDETFDQIIANYSSIETSDSKQGRTVQIIEHEKDKGRRRRDLVQEDEDKAIGTVSWRLYWGYFRSGLPSVIIVCLFLFFAAAQATAGFLLAYVISIVRQTSVAMRFASDVETQMISVERVKRYTTLSAESGYERQRKPPQDWPDQGALSLQGVSMVYLEGGACVLKDIKFDVKPQEKVGIAGRTGAGKSSLVAALFRMPDPQGHVIIDGIDLGTLNLPVARRSMAVISQNPVLFSGTLKHNLDPFHRFTDEQIWKSLTEVQMKTRVSKLDGLLEYRIGENGSGFSVGETQLLCLARALLQRCKILVLDEATANVDYKTDRLVQQVIREKFCNCTVLTIAHRLNTIMDYDRVLVLDRGHVVEYDSPTILAAKSDGVFAQLLKTSDMTVHTKSDN